MPGIEEPKQSARQRATMADEELESYLRGSERNP